ncbi:MAG: DNA-methyltransferase, partial [Candidatus Helarchaeota archaeon]
MNLPFNKIICGDCITEMKKFPLNSVDCVVTSPPYWGLRDYGTETNRIWGGNPDCEHKWAEHIVGLSSVNRKGLSTSQTSIKRELHGQHKQLAETCAKCGAWRGQLGLEPHPEMYVNHLVLIFREVKRVLKPSGTFWLNLGDTYYTKSGSSFKGSTEQFTSSAERYGLSKINELREKYKSNWLQPKQLLGIPWRVAIALQHDGWILRNSIIWEKPNHMPSSVKDRLTNAYEFVFLFAKQRRYWFDLDAIRVPHQTNPFQMEYRKQLWASRGKDVSYQFNKEKRLADGPNTGVRNKAPYKVNNPHISRITKRREAGNIKGKNPGDVWTIPTTAFSGAHFATFPPK